MNRNLLSSPASKEIKLGGLTYSLEGEGRWSAQYRSGRQILVISKVLDGLFDMSWLQDNEPSQLPENERNAAALALYVAGEREDIPSAWRSFAVGIFGPNGEATKPKELKEAEQGVAPNRSLPSTLKSTSPVRGSED